MGRVRAPGVKVCGLTRVEDAVLAVELGADFVGLNFWPRSPRYLSPEAARPIVEAVRGRARLVGVWVDPDRQEVQSIDDELRLDLLQFHGDRVPGSVNWFPDRVIKALRVDTDFSEEDLCQFDEAWGFLFDRAPAGVFGGTGESWSYERIADLETPKPVLLAGGLNPGNVGAAIVASSADIVDVCSGVETRPGIKDRALLVRFMDEVGNVKDRD